MWVSREYKRKVSHIDDRGEDEECCDYQRVNKE